MMSTPEELADLQRLAQRVIDVRTALERGNHELGAYAAFDSAAADLQARLSPERLLSLIEAHERLRQRLQALEGQVPP